MHCNVYYYPTLSNANFLRFISGPLTYSHNGGPVTVVGIYSRAIGCGRPYFPDIYSRVTSVLSWIEEVLNRVE